MRAGAGQRAEVIIARLGKARRRAQASRWERLLHACWKRVDRPRPTPRFKLVACIGATRPREARVSGRVHAFQNWIADVAMRWARCRQGTRPGEAEGGSMAHRALLRPCSRTNPAEGHQSCWAKLVDVEVAGP